MVAGLQVTIVFGALIFVITTKVLATRMDENQADREYTTGRVRKYWSMLSDRK